MINRADQGLASVTSMTCPGVRVRSVSLRAKLSCSELHELILDVRRHVELVGTRERSHSRYGICRIAIGICSAHYGIPFVMH